VRIRFPYVPLPTSSSLILAASGSPPPQIHRERHHSPSRGRRHHRSRYDSESDGDISDWDYEDSETDTLVGSPRESRRNLSRHSTLRERTPDRSPHRRRQHEHRDQTPPRPERRSQWHIAATGSPRHYARFRDAVRDTFEGRVEDCVIETRNGDLQCWILAPRRDDVPLVYSSTNNRFERRDRAERTRDPSQRQEREAAPSSSRRSGRHRDGHRSRWRVWR